MHLVLRKTLIGLFWLWLSDPSCTARLSQEDGVSVSHCVTSDMYLRAYDAEFLFPSPSPSYSLLSFTLVFFSFYVCLHASFCLCLLFSLSVSFSFIHIFSHQNSKLLFKTFLLEFRKKKHLGALIYFYFFKDQLL